MIASMTRRSSAQIPLSTTDQPLNGQLVTQYWMIWGTGPNVAKATASMQQVSAEGGAEAVIGVRVCSASDIPQGSRIAPYKATEFVAYGTAVRF